MLKQLSPIFVQVRSCHFVIDFDKNWENLGTKTGHKLALRTKLRFIEDKSWVLWLKTSQILGKDKIKT